MRHMGLKNPRSKKPTWKFTKKQTKWFKIARDVDWYCYQKKFLFKLILFAKECQIKRLNTIVQEDKALDYAFKH